MINVYIAGTLQLPYERIEASYITIEDELLVQYGSLSGFIPPENGLLIDMSGRLMVCENELVIGRPIEILANNKHNQYAVIQKGSIVTT